MTETERYNSIVKETTPRLVFEYTITEDGIESIKWGVHGVIPTPLLIAAAIKAQTMLCTGARYIYRDWFEPCPEMKLVIAWPSLDTTIEMAIPIKHHEHLWFLHASVPVDYLLTMIEIAKSTILASMIMRQQQEQQAQSKVQIYRADGRIVN